MENKSVADSIVNYYSGCDGYEDQTKFILKKVSEVIDLEMEIFDLRKLSEGSIRSKLNLRDSDLKRLYN